MVNFLSKFFKKDQVKKLSEIDGPREIVIHESLTGSYGTSIYGGYIQEDYLDKLDYSLKADIYDQMRRGDANVRMLTSATKNPIKAGTWEIDVGEDTPEADKDRLFIEHVLFNSMRTPWDKFISEALTMVEFGHSVFEITHELNKNDPELGNYIGLRNLSWRSPRTIQRWNVDPTTEELVSISQHAYGDIGKMVEIPAEFILLFNLEQEGANFEGISLLRPCYGNWLRKNNYLKLNAAGIEKFAIPTPIATVPDGMHNSPEHKTLLRILSAYTSHQSNFITKAAGWDVELSPNNSYDPAKVEVSIDNEDKRMSKAFMANFLELLGGGSYALSQDLSDFFLSGIDHIAREITSKINTLLIPHLIKINFGPRAKYPKLKVSGISDRAGEELARILSMLATQKIIVPDDVLEDHLRKRYNLPMRSEDGQRTAQPVQPQNDFSKSLDERISLMRKMNGKN